MLGLMQTQIVLEKYDCIKKNDLMVINWSKQQGVFVQVVLCDPLSSEIRMFFSSGYRKGTSSVKAYDLLQERVRNFFLGFMTCFRGEGQGKMRVTFLLLLFSQLARCHILGQHVLNSVTITESFQKSITLKYFPFCFWFLLIRK